MKEQWVKAFAESLQGEVSQQVLDDFWRWIAETYTLTPADRPNWEGYETFFFEWYVHMRDGEDTARCFKAPREVYETYVAFNPARRLDLRIQESRTRSLSDWDATVFSRCKYSLSQGDLENEETFDPFGSVSATAERNYFQRFWEHLDPRLSADEKGQLFVSLRQYHKDRPWQQDMVPPDKLSRQIR